MAWRFTVLGETFRESELTLGQAERIEDLLTTPEQVDKGQRANWGQINPLRSAKAARRIAAVMYADRMQTPYDEVLVKLEAVGMIEFIDEFSPIEDDLPTSWEGSLPTGADGEQTATSSASPESPGSGPRT